MIRRGKVMDDKKLQGQKLDDVSYMQVVVAFADGSGQIVPLTPLQGAFVALSLGFRQDLDTKEILHFTDKELDDMYGLTKKD